MIFDYSFKTGGEYAELYSPIPKENIKDYFTSNFVFSSNAISGENSTRLSLNGQTLAEQTAIIVDAGFEQIYLNSGDYYLKTGSSYKEVFFNSLLNVKSFKEKNIFYNIKDESSEVALGSGISPEAMESGLNNQLSILFPSKTGTMSGMESFDFFLNGQKIYTGANGSYEISGLDFKFFYNENITGKLFAIPKNTGFENKIDYVADVYGAEFVESTVFCYFNGLSVDKKNWIEMHTGVNLITTGIQAQIFEKTITTQSLII